MDSAAVLLLLAQARASAAVGQPIAPDPEITPYLCRARLVTVTTVEAATAVVARAVAVKGGDLAEVAEAWAQRTPNPITRSLSRVHGRALLAAAAETNSTIEPASLPHPVALGLVAAAEGVDAVDLARLIGYDDVQSVLAHADPTDALVWSHALMDDIVAMAAQVAHLDDPERIPATGAALVQVAGAS